MHLSHCYKSVKEIFALLRVGLGYYPLITVAVGTRLIGINTGHQNQLIADFTIDTGKPVGVIDNSLLIIG